MGQRARGIRVMDDRGVERAMVTMSMMGAGAVHTRDPELMELALRASQTGRTPVVGWVVATMIAVAAAGFGGVVLARAAAMSIPTWAMVVAFAIVLAGVMAIITRIHTAKNASMIADLYLGDGRCPCCAYRLGGLVAEADGCLTCPECGAVWRAGRLGAPENLPEVLRAHRRRLFVRTPRERLFGPQTLGLTRDALGRAVYVVDPRLRRIDEAGVARLGAERVAAARHEARRHNRIAGPMWALVMLLPIFAMIRMLMNSRPPAGAGPLATALAFGSFVFWSLVTITIVFAAVGLVTGENGLNLKRSVRTLVRHGICPQCLSPLDDARQVDESTAACAACGAAWADVPATGPSSATEALSPEGSSSPPA